MRVTEASGRQVSLMVNGQPRTASVEPRDLLVDVLRDTFGLKGTKKGCNVGVCGACTVLVEGQSRKSCLTLALMMEGRAITTIEGLSREGGLDPVQEAFVAHGASQCGYCTPGMILAAKSLLAEGANLDEDAVREGLKGNLCRCTGYTSIVDAVLEVAGGNRDTPANEP